MIDNSGKSAKCRITCNLTPVRNTDKSIILTTSSKLLAASSAARSALSRARLWHSFCRRKPLTKLCTLGKLQPLTPRRCFLRVLDCQIQGELSPQRLDELASGSNVLAQDSDDYEGERS